mgnify:CR=1 FL=1
MVECMMKNAKIARRNLAREVDKTLKSDIIKGKECLKFNIVEEFKMKVLVETSARHLHLSQEHLEILFGKGHELTVKKMLSQPGQFACEEKVQVIGPKSSLKMSVLGPVRKDTQVEVSLTDARAIGVTAPIRESGDIAGSGACKLVGPAGEVELTEGVIAAKRHVHMTPEDAEAAGVKDKDIVKLDIQSPNGRSLTFGDVVVRVSASYATAAHIDTDEANALCPGKECYGEMIK